VVVNQIVNPSRGDTCLHGQIPSQRHRKNIHYHITQRHSAMLCTRNRVKEMKPIMNATVQLSVNSTRMENMPGELADMEGIWLRRLITVEALARTVSGAGM